jgi:hypothetical protein
MVVWKDFNGSIKRRSSMTRRSQALIKAPTHDYCYLGGVLSSQTAACRATSMGMIRLKRIYNFSCSMLVYAPFALCFVKLHGVFKHFLELTY